MALYDTIGRGYRRHRRQDPRIAARIFAALGAARSVVNVGAGAGSYEPRDRALVAVEPSQVMIRQRDRAAAPVVRASATALPFRDASFDASLAILTIHHWPDLARGLDELRRAARRRVVILTFDPAVRFWLNDYFPEIAEVDARSLPPVSALRRHLGRVAVHDVPIPHDCTDGFLGAYWRRPEAYLRADVRSAISTFGKLRDVESGLAALRADLASGEWTGSTARSVRGARSTSAIGWWSPSAAPLVVGVVGIDSLQALVLALGYANQMIPFEAKRAGGRIDWLGETEQPVFATTRMLELLEDAARHMRSGLCDAAAALRAESLQPARRAALVARLDLLAETWGHRGRRAAKRRVARRTTRGR
jgi:SAM-dependent methyltransferase